MTEHQMRRWQWLPLAVAGIFCLAWLFRPLWFDEALTRVEFVALSSPAQIYWRYNIPNNHILFTLLLRGWVELTGACGLGGGVIDRGLPLLITGGALTVSAVFWQRVGGKAAATMLLWALILSRPFEIYSMALRGYMLSFLTITLALAAFRRWTASGKYRYCGYYFLAALAAVGTIPSNLAALVAVPLVFLPERGRDIFRLKFLLPALLPVVALVMFYLPIRDKLLHNLALGEGWYDRGAAVGVVYGGWLFALLPVLAAAIPGAVTAWRQRPGWTRWGRMAVFSLPLLC
ncbi:MAG: hypothetical protein PHQ27_10255, partial [Victivallales bacterium]|nr:hypothetical protein [Victivallales bacterium]